MRRSYLILVLCMCTECNIIITVIIIMLKNEKELRSIPMTDSRLESIDERHRHNNILSEIKHIYFNSVISHILF